MLAVLLALSSSLCWGVADFVGGVQARRLPLLVVTLVSQAVGLVGVLIFVAARGKAPPDLAHLLPAAGGGIAGIAALNAFYRALSIGTMSIVAPISATGAAVPVIVGVASGERPGVFQVVGILTAIVGVALASREESQEQEQRNVSRTSVALALVAALGFGAFFVGLRSGARADAAWAVVAARSAGVVALILVAAVAIARNRSAAPRAEWRELAARLPLLPLAAMGILDLSANALYAVATRHGLLSVVAVAASLYPLATVVLARMLLGERVRRIQELGIAAALLGVVLIAAG